MKVYYIKSEGFYFWSVHKPKENEELIKTKKLNEKLLNELNRTHQISETDKDFIILELIQELKKGERRYKK